MTILSIWNPFAGLTFETIAGRIVLTSAVAAAIIYLWAKVIWHPRSWFRRVPTYLVVRILIAPNARKATTFLIGFFEQHITPQLDAKIESVRTDVNEVRVELRELKVENTEQHSTNQHAIKAIASQQAKTSQKLLETNAKLATVLEHTAVTLKTPGFPHDPPDTVDP